MSAMRGLRYLGLKSALARNALCVFFVLGAASSDSDTFGDLKAELLDEGDSEQSDFGKSVLNPVTEDDVKRSLDDFLNASMDDRHMAKLSQLKSALRPMFVALPKDEENLLAYQTALYAVHRFMMSWRGWFIRGLEPSDAEVVHNKSLISSEWVPGYIMGILSERSGKLGASLDDISIVAATLEKLIHAEMANKLEAVYEYLGFSTTEPLERQHVSCALEAFLYYVLTFDHVQARVRIDPFEHASASTSERQRIMCGSQLNALSTDKIAELYSWLASKLNAIPGNEHDLISFSSATTFAHAVADEYQSFNDADCNDLKGGLIAMEGRDGPAKPGRVSVATYHNTGSYKYWIFGESVENLRLASILDESDSVPTVVVPNILASRFNCVESSSLYAICCKIECDMLLAQIELSLQASGGTADQIAHFVSRLSSSSGPAPDLSQAQVGRLQQLQDAHDGLVPIYSEAFAMWMHRAYPRECPLPHPEHSSTFPMTPGEWLRGVSTSWADESSAQAEMQYASESRKSPNADVARLFLLMSFLSALLWLALQHPFKCVQERKDKDDNDGKKSSYKLFGIERNLVIARQLLVVFGFGSAGAYFMIAEDCLCGIVFMCACYLLSRTKLMNRRGQAVGKASTKACHVDDDVDDDCGKYI
eukprot:TRINITY_DN2485_c0_g3_i2.p1 TRINITY_DN2485_c0_g3~~TRINITY_DN2485_c0_g3_i2.p1  ORF type:complete len:650 (-),score=100.19 TRINITY_DN2485_c0_g3_i2:105-2054(-)